MSERGLAWCWIALGLFTAGFFVWFTLGLPDSPHSGKWYVSGLMNGFGLSMYAVGLSLLDSTRKG